MIDNINNCNSLEKIKVLDNLKGYESYNRLIKIILSNKTLKEIDISINSITNEEISAIGLINEQITKIQLKINNVLLNLNDFMTKFLKLKTLNLWNSFYSIYDKYEIINNENINIDDISLYNYLSDKKLSFSFSKIKNLELSYVSLNDLSFSLLNNQCKDIFNSLYSLKIFEEIPIKYELLNN